MLQQQTATLVERVAVKWSHNKLPLWGRRWQSGATTNCHIGGEGGSQVPQQTATLVERVAVN